LCRSCRFLRGHMDVRPPLVILTGIEDYEVKPPESETDISEVRSVTSVTTHEDPSPKAVPVRFESAGFPGG
jgi:hypothetical protein